MPKSERPTDKQLTILRRMRDEGYLLAWAGPNRGGPMLQRIVSNHAGRLRLDSPSNCHVPLASYTSLHHRGLTEHLSEDHMGQIHTLLLYSDPWSRAALSRISVDGLVSIV